jgi:diacylglycerol kinase (ATP)
VQIAIILNPTAGSGRAKTAGLALQARLPGAELFLTSGPGDAVQLAREARKQGADIVAAVGGDGTIQQCATGITFEDDGSLVSHQTALAILPAGTGGDYRRTFGFTESIDQVATRISSREIRAVDFGRLTYRREQTTNVTGFANVLSFGLGGLTDRFVETGPKWLGGRTAFLLGAMRAAAVHQSTPVDLLLDDELVETAPYSNVAVCLGQYFGGGMKIAPQADPSDGLFDVITMEMGKVQTLSLSLDIYRGTHLKRSGVKHYRCRKLEARLTRTGESLLDADGEQLGTLPLTAELLPSALALIV